MAEPHQSIGQMLYPLWLVGGNLVARLGGAIILLVIGRSFAPDTLGDYFALLAVLGLAVTATQAGSGPLLVRLAQANRFLAAFMLVGFRGLIAVIVVTVVISQTKLGISDYWPLLLMPLACALSPDWIISARNEFSKLAALAVLAQLVGITTAIWAAATQQIIVLYGVAPAVSVANLVCSSVLAFRLRKDHPPRSNPAIPLQDQRTAIGLIGFTLLAGFLPNFDFALLSVGDTTLFLAQRVFLVCAGLLAAIAGALFAKNQSGYLRDGWLLVPMAVVSLLLFSVPHLITSLIYGVKSADLTELLRTGALWPLLLALIGRQILILQETAHSFLLGWLCLVVLMLTALLAPSFTDPGDALVWMQARFAILLCILHAWHWQHRPRRATA
jgi:O-antigen/teichoic acid export membrane protein